MYANGDILSLIINPVQWSLSFIVELITEL